jgi:hypothetical protein
MENRTNRAKEGSRKFFVKNVISLKFESNKMNEGFQTIKGRTAD